MVSKNVYGTYLENLFKMSRQGIRWRFNRLFNEIYISAYVSIIWLESTYQSIKGRISQDNGQTWGPIETIVSLSDNQTIATDLSTRGGIDIGSYNGKISLIYSIKDGGSRDGVYLTELDI